MRWSEEEGKRTRAMRMTAIGDLFLVRGSFVVHQGVFFFVGSAFGCFWRFWVVDRGAWSPIGIPC